MALEIAPTPAKAAPPAKSSAPAAAARTDSADGGTKPASNGKGGKAADPAGFLALLMGLGQEASTDSAADPTSLVADATALTTSSTELDAKELNSDPMVALPGSMQTAPLPDATALPTMARPGGLRPVVQPDALESTDKASLGARRRSQLQAGNASPTDTQQLQTETAQEATANSLRATEVGAPREGKLATVGLPETQASAIPIPLQAPIAADEARKATHGLLAKVEVAENLVLLSSGLSGTMAIGGGMTDVAASGNATQFQSVVAQEVAFYVSQDVQSAEMKLEGVGGGPVEVSINMQGKEAQVVFRTDELHTREMLQSATAQLKDMLQQQGVVLTGVFVGSSGAGDAGQQQDRRFRQGARSEATLRIATQEVRGAGVSIAGVGRTLDLYV